MIAVAHPADDVAEAVDLDGVVAELFHLSLDAGDDFALLAALAGVGDHLAKEANHVHLVALGSLLDALEIHNSNLLKSCCVPKLEV